MATFDLIGWIVEAKIKTGRREEFQEIVEAIVAATKKVGGTITYIYFVSDDVDVDDDVEVLMLEPSAVVESAHIHITNWDNYSERWLDAALAPKLLKPFGGFAG